MPLRAVQVAAVERVLDQAVIALGDRDQALAGSRVVRLQFEHALKALEGVVVRRAGQPQFRQIDLCGIDQLGDLALPEVLR